MKFLVEWISGSAEVVQETWEFSSPGEISDFLQANPHYGIVESTLLLSVKHKDEIAGRVVSS